MPLYLSSIVRTELTSLWEETHKKGMAYIMGIVHSHEDESKLALLKKCNLRHFQIKFPIIHPICPEKKILHNLCFSFVLAITAVPRETENSAYAKFGGRIRCIMGNVEVIPQNGIFYSTSAICTSPITRLVCPPKFFYDPCTLFPLGITVVPRESKELLIQNNVYYRRWENS